MIDADAPSATLYQSALDAIDAAIVVFDRDERLQLCNEAFRSLYAPIAAEIVTGARFEDLLRAAIARGLIPDAAADPAAFVARRLAQHRAPGAPIRRRLADGRWRHIAEQRLPDGRVLGFSIDITDAVEREFALQAAQQEAQRHRERLEDAIEVLPDGFALYDDADRLVVANRRYRELYAVSADRIQPGATFESMLRDGLERGQYPGAAGCETAWLAERLHRHRHPGEPLCRSCRATAGCASTSDRRATAGSPACAQTSPNSCDASSNCSGSTPNSPRADASSPSCRRPMR